jgi:hypothetical protein
MRWMLLLLLISALACKQPAEKVVIAVPRPIVIPHDTIVSTDSLLQLHNGVYYLKGQLFSGYLKSFHGNGIVKAVQSFHQGKQEGWAYEYFENGKPLSKRYYHLGEKDSVHTGWWDNGNTRFVYHFKNGVYDGSFEEYYYIGKPLKKISYYNGNDSFGTGWRENGKIFMNYIMKDGRRYGVMNAQPCYSLKNERGEYKK